MNIIDAYTRADGAGGADLVWNVSTWNPYGVVLVKSHVTAGSSAPPRPCRGRGGQRPRWCAGR